MDEFTQEIYPEYKIEHRTYRRPEVLSWGEGGHSEIGAFCSITAGIMIFLGGEKKVDWRRPLRQVF